MTEFYDSYLDSYTQASEPPLPSLPSSSIGSGPGSGGGPNPERIAAWARSNATPINPPQRVLSRSAPSSNYAPSSFGSGGSLRRRLTRRTTTRSRAPVSMYEEEEEGYVSGEYEDGPFELVKIRVKVRDF
jgi:neutrophil factor 2